MKIRCFFVAMVTLLSSSVTMADNMVSPEDSLWSSIQCGGKKVDLMVNHRTVAQPTLFIARNDNDVKNISFQSDVCYTELQCINYQGRPAVHFVETSCGNAYETYWVVDVNSFKKYDLDYNTAKKAGIVNY